MGSVFIALTKWVEIFFFNLHNLILKLKDINLSGKNILYIIVLIWITLNKYHMQKLKIRFLYYCDAIPYQEATKS